MLRGDGVIHLAILQKLMGGLNEKKLQNTFYNDLLEDTSLLAVADGGRKRWGFNGCRLKGSWSDEFLEGSCT